eukprot:1354504-Pleurochrysis_carterae.AAC.1
MSTVTLQRLHRVALLQKRLPLLPTTTAYAGKCFLSTYNVLFLLPVAFDAARRLFKVDLALRGLAQQHISMQPSRNSVSHLLCRCKPRNGSEKWGANQWIWNHPC